MREYVVENEFVKAVRKAGGVAYKLTSQTANGLPDRLVLFFPAKTIFVELKAPGKDAVGIHDAIGRQQDTILINESGLYSLILSSKL